MEEQAPSSETQAGPRERILEASLKLFVEQGYFNTNVPDISKHSRCSVGSIYHHFLNKEEIAADLYKAGIQQFRNRLTKAINSDDDLETTVNDLVVSFLGFAEENKLLSRYIWLARHTEFLNQKVSRPTTVGFDPLGRKLTKIIKGAIRKGEMQRNDAEVIWSIMFGIPLSFVRDWLDGYTKKSPTEVAPAIASACLAALRGAK